MHLQPTICCDEERIPGASAEEVRVKQRPVLLVSADEKVFVGRVTAVNVNSYSAIGPSVYTSSDSIDSQNGYRVRNCALMQW